MKQWIIACLLLVLAIVLVTDYHSQEEVNPAPLQGCTTRF